MISWSRIQQAISHANKSKISKIQGDLHILDKLALVLQGVNACVAVYVQSNNQLLIAANYKPSINITFTNYVDECMLDYMIALRRNDIPLLQQTLANDKRLKLSPKSSLPFFKEVVKDINNVCKFLIEDLTPYGEIDEIAQDIQDMENNSSEIGKIENIQSYLSQFSKYIKGLETTSPENLISSFQDFVNIIKGNLNSLSKELSKSYSQEIRAINRKLDNVISQDLKFVNALKDIISSLNLLSFINNEHKTVTEISENDLFQTLIELQENWGQYHAEHRLAVNINAVRNLNEDLDYIGISKYCCPICYFIVHIKYNIKVAGKHTDFYYGDSLIGLKFHDPQKQFEIIKELFPMLESDAQDALNLVVTGNLADTDMQDV